MRKNKGFTLIELVVVIAILGILAGIAIPRFLDAQATARGSKVLADMRTLESALNIYTINNSFTKAGVNDIDVMASGSNPVIASIPKPPSGHAIFPNGYEMDIESDYKYQVYHRTNTKENFIILYAGSAQPITVDILENAKKDDL